MMEVRGRILPPPKLQYGGRVASLSGQVGWHVSFIVVLFFSFSSVQRLQTLELFKLMSNIHSWTKLTQQENFILVCNVQDFNDLCG